MFIMQDVTLLYKLGTSIQRVSSLYLVAQSCMCGEAMLIG